MGYFLGVDGGASSTTCAVCSDDGAVLGIGRGNASNHILAPGGRERARAAVGGAIEAALRAAGLGTIEYRAAQFGMTGIVAGTERAQAFAEVVADLLRAETVVINEDSWIALAGALACGPGVMVIAGTGSVAVGLDPDGRADRAGGWGYIFGDDGSAFALGRGGVHAALHARDGSGPDTILVERIPSAIGMDLTAITWEFYQGHQPRRDRTTRHRRHGVGRRGRSRRPAARRGCRRGAGESRGGGDPPPSLARRCDRGGAGGGRVRRRRRSCCIPCARRWPPARPGRSWCRRGTTRSRAPCCSRCAPPGCPTPLSGSRCLPRPGTCRRPRRECRVGTPAARRPDRVVPGTAGQPAA